MPSPKEIRDRKAAHAFKFTTCAASAADTQKDSTSSRGKRSRDTTDGDENKDTTTAPPLVATDTLEGLRQRSQRFADAREWNQFHNPRNVLLALSGEVGEVAELFQWKPDEDCQIGLPNWSEEDRGKVEDEIADVFSYVLRLAAVCHVDLPVALERKMQKNESKYPSEIVAGSSAKYTEYKQKAREEKIINTTEQQNADGGKQSED